MRLRTIPSLLVLSLTVAAVQPAAAARSTVSFTVSPHTAKAAGKIKVRASHLSARSAYFLLFVPAKKPKLKRFIAAETTDTHGRFSGTVNLPYVPYCGRATVDLMSTRKVVAHAGLRVTGCNPKVGTPPPPPKQ